MPRSVWLRNEAAREGFENDATIFFPAFLGVPRPRRARPTSFRDAFHRHYGPIRALLERHREATGLGLVVVSDEGVEAAVWVPAEAGGINPVIVGRHSRAEVFLPWDPELSLRHLAVILKGAGGGPRFRVLDLRTATAFGDEQGRRLQALESAGPTMIECASFAVLLFPTATSDEPWPDDPEAGWGRIPGRVYLDSTSADPEWWNRPAGVVARPVPVWERNGTPTISVVTFPGPAFLSPDPAEDGPARGEIRVSSPYGSASLLLHSEAARRGALLGRYGRCDGAGLPCLSSLALSRVHLLVIESEGTLWAIDTASRNGTWDGDRPIRRARLDPGRRLRLAADVMVEWCPFH